MLVQISMGSLLKKALKQTETESPEVQVEIVEDYSHAEFQGLELAP